MAEQEQAQDSQEAVTEEGAPSAETENTDTGAEDTPQQEHMIPKSRFDEINAELKQLRAAQTKAEKDREEAERKAAEEQGKFKELYEAQQAKAEEAERKARDLELSILRSRVAKEAGLPERLADRLRGETEEELTQDAESLLETLPRPQAPNINSASGNGNAPTKSQALGGMTEDEFSAVYGVKAKYLAS